MRISIRTAIRAFFISISLLLLLSHSCELVGKLEELFAQSTKLSGEISDDDDT